ncbi:MULTISPECIES: GNAT family N-acetyltransferase [Brevibacterium]|nr:MULTISPECIES: GNAT family protein [Brevibacterium]MCT1829338.1 GNAT family N-acetyltransferase [Brevibacterium luteolum]
MQHTDVMSLEEIWPPYALTIACGNMTLSPVRDSDLPELAALATGGVQTHPGAFIVDWDQGTAAEVARNLATYHWRTRAATNPDEWTLELTVRVDGEAVGVQSAGARAFAKRRTVGTGSWLSKTHQGRGIGTRMRQALAVTCFDHFGACELATSYFEGNNSSRRVSEKVGYVDNGSVIDVSASGSHVGREYNMLLTPDRLVRPDEEVTVTGAEVVAEFLQLPTAPGVSEH